MKTPSDSRKFRVIDLYLFLIEAGVHAPVFLERCQAVLDYMAGRSILPGSDAGRKIYVDSINSIFVLQHRDLLNIGATVGGNKLGTIRRELLRLEEPAQRQQAIERWLSRLDIGEDQMVELVPLDGDPIEEFVNAVILAQTTPKN